MVKAPLTLNLTACSIQLRMNNHTVRRTLSTLHLAQQVSRDTSCGTFLNRNLRSCVVSMHVHSGRGGLLWNNRLDRQHALFAAFCVVSEVCDMSRNFRLINVEYNKDAQHVPNDRGHATDVQ